MTHKDHPGVQLWTALATPFKEDGSVDMHGFLKLLDHQIQGGVYGVVLGGSTGENLTLTIEERLTLVKKAKAHVGSRVQVMAGVGGSSTEQTKELAKLACDGGADGLLVVTPPYSKPNMSGLQQHFQVIASSVSKPLCLYHVPGRTAHKLTSSEILALLAIPGVDALKESSGDPGLFSLVRQNTTKLCWAGDDYMYLPSLALGAHGLVSVLSNLYPKAARMLGEAFQDGKPERALEIHHALNPLMQALYCETNPCPLKAALSIKGFCGPYLRLPLAQVSPQHYGLLTETLAHTDFALSALGVL